MEAGPDLFDYNKYLCTTYAGSMGRRAICCRTTTGKTKDMTTSLRHTDTNTGNAIEDKLREGRILILDGATGTMLQRFRLGEEDFRSGPFSGCRKELKGNNECLNITRPDIIRRIHEEYIAAGADIIETNTFSANRISQEEYGCGGFAYRMAFEGARIAREAAGNAGRKIFVAGSIGPTSRSLSLSPDMDDPAYRAVSFDEMCQAYSGQIKGLMLGGADLLLIETCFDALNAKAALYAIEKLLEDKEISGNPEIASRLSSEGYFPVIVSVSVSDRSGRTLTGQTIEAFWTSVSHYPLTAFGLNCSLGADEMYPLLKDAAGFASCPVSCYPNAGLPDGMGGYAETPEEMAAAIRRMASDGLLDIAGGCCGTTPEYIRAIASAVKGLPSRTALRKSSNDMGKAGSGPSLVVCGLETVRIDLKTRNFTNVGERTNVAGSRKFAKVIAAGNYTQALEIAAGQIESGADIIDINMDDAMLDSTAQMAAFLRYISNDPAVAKAALMIDSSHWETVLAGLKNAQGKSIVNSISLKEGEEAFIAKAREIHRLGAAMVVMAFDEQGQATTFSRKTEICARAYRLLVDKAGIPPCDIIFDVNVLAVGTGIEEHAEYAVDFIKAVAWIKANLPGALTSGGVSNLSFAFRGNNPVREAMHSVFLYHAIKAGLDMAIVNPGMLQIYDEIEPGLLKCAEDVILDRDSGATERLIEKAAEIAQARDSSSGAPAVSADNAAETPASPEERLAGALVKGRSETLASDLGECLVKYGSAVSIIEGPLMDGMKKVGELFGSGKMFLPQVVKSAKVMREAVDLLQPHMDADSRPSGDTHARPKIVIATVKGDVHDIGKNITAIVLGCNGFDVIDLGVMVDKETILDTAAREHADIIAASGLITPSLFQMEELCREMASRGMDTPLFIGGATTSALHTAVKLAPLYGHVFYGADASASAVMAKRCMIDRRKFEDEEHSAQEKLRSLYLSGKNSSTDDKVKNGVNGSRSEGQEIPVYRNEEAKNQETSAGDSRKAGEEHIFAPGRYLRIPAPQDMEATEIAIDQVLPYFDWKMLYAIWGIRYGKVEPDAPEMTELHKEAEAVLERFRKSHGCRIMTGTKWFNASAEDDTISMEKDGETMALPMFRQEKPMKLSDGRSVCLSLSDFVPPRSYGFTSPAGIFAISVSKAAQEDGHRGCGCSTCRSGADYDDMLERSVMNTLAEAASSWLDVQIGKWLTEGEKDRHDPQGHQIQEWKIIKPAAGYSSCPDHTVKRDILRMIPGNDKLGIRLTGSCAMIPDASICGMIFVHRDATYPEIRNISAESYGSYVRKRQMPGTEARRFLGHLLAE